MSIHCNCNLIKIYLKSNSNMDKPVFYILKSKAKMFPFLCLPVEWGTCLFMDSLWLLLVDDSSVRELVVYYLFQNLKLSN